jgi:hypothetical protein
MEELYKDIEFQQKASEIILVVQTLPRQGKIVWPKVPEETHNVQCWATGCVTSSIQP